MIQGKKLGVKNRGAHPTLIYLFAPSSVCNQVPRYSLARSLAAASPAPAAAALALRFPSRGHSYAERGKKIWGGGGLRCFLPPERNSCHEVKGGA